MSSYWGSSAGAGHFLSVFNTLIQDNSESSEGRKNVDIKSMEKEFLKKTSISDIKTTTTHTLPSRQL